MTGIEEILRGRAGLYYLLSSLFKNPPGPDFLTDLRDGRLSVPDVDGIRRGFEVMRSHVSSFESIEDAETAVKQEFTELFIGPFGSPVSPVQSTYEGDEPYREVSARVMGKYMKMGYRKAVKEEPPDHIAVELAFLGESCMNAVNPEMRINELRNQKRFLEEELTKWVFQFCEEVKKRGKFYRGVAIVLEEFMKLERELIPELMHHEL
ncbi:TorD/DmsD family molecular chaperone [Geoglobus sp.]